MADTVATIFGDLHGGDTNSGVVFEDRPGFTRHSTSYERRRNEIVTEAASSDVLVNLCDTVAVACSDGQKLSTFTGILDYFDANLSCDAIHAIGNHIYRLNTSYEWDGAGSAPSMSDYFTALDNSTSEGVKANAFGEDSDPYSFTYTDTNGLLWIHVCCPYGNTFVDRDANDHLDWLDTRLQAADTAGTPCVVISHTQLWQNDTCSVPTTLRVNDTDWPTLQTMYDATETLQAVFGAHSHAGGQWMKWHDIWFLDVEGSCSMPPDQTSTANAYMTVTISPQEIWTPYGWKAKIQISNGGLCRLSKSYDKFLVA